MEPAPTETQIKVVEEQVPDRQLQYEKGVDERFDRIEKQLAEQPTMAQFTAALAGLAKTEDIARLNNIVHNFTIAAQVLSVGSKWTSRFLIALATTFIAIGIIKGGIAGAGAWIAHHIFGVN